MSDVVRSRFLGYLHDIEQCCSLSAIQEVIWYAASSWYMNKLDDDQFHQIVDAGLYRAAVLRKSQLDRINKRRI